MLQQLAKQQLSSKRAKFTDRHCYSKMAIIVKSKKHAILCTTALSTMVVNSSFCHAFNVSPVLVKQQANLYNLPQSSTNILNHYNPPVTPSFSTLRMFSSYNNNNNNNEGGFLSKIKKAAKSVLPASWFQSDQERQVALERQKIRKEVQGGLQDLFREAPLPVRLMSRMIGPMISGIMSSVAETLQEQEQNAKAVLDQAQQYIVRDSQALDLLGGEPIQIGQVFSQSTSTSIINGQSTSRVDLGFSVVGGNGSSGTARLSSLNNVIQSLQVQAQGRVVSVNLSGSNNINGGSSRSKRVTASSSSNYPRPDEIIEAEIIEKKTK